MPQAHDYPVFYQATSLGIQTEPTQMQLEVSWV
jgi:hypothetical protein